ncbi:ABC transporter permease [Bifidobacterium panos]|uniref:ABC transporter permease n=1 Tax=Bifidobacterium panos TaxID=2675321 RepID=A0ABX1SX31_9BIFI|nr:ABC transporter permease [Bifidobacterium sp. DSM 109963]NMN02390.1 ABC transporter permease [Bifidobacterium sp. DSM 109963]
MNNRRMFITMLFGAVFRRRSRAAMAVIAVLVGATTLFALASICIAVPQQMNEEMRAYGANLIVTPSETAEGNGGLDADTVQNVTALISGEYGAKSASYRYESVRINSAPYTLAGIDPTAVKQLNQHWNVTGDWPAAGNVMVGRDVADALGVGIGSRITIGYRASDNGSTDTASDATSGDTEEDTQESTEETSGHSSAHMHDGRVSSDIMETSGTEFRVSGIVDTGGSEDEIVYATNADLSKLAGGERGADVVEYSVNAFGSDLDALVKSLNKNPNTGVKAQTVTKITSSDTRIITMLQTLFWIVSLVVLVLTLVGVGTTISSIVSQRRNEIGLRKALGAPSRAIGAEFYVESGVYGLVGGLAGTAIGYALARVLCQAVFERAIGFNWPLGLASATLSVLLAVAASVPPVRRATRIDPAVVLREE